MKQDHYRTLGIMFGVHFLAMYILMYAMVNDFGANVYNNLNQLYMAALMTSSMIFIELALMRSMYSDSKKNIAVLVAGTALLVGSFALIRKQTAIADKQFVRSMIPHHASAILMCQNASIHDQELKGVCREIISGQQREIDQMKGILKRLEDSK